MLESIFPEEITGSSCSIYPAITTGAYINSLLTFLLRTYPKRNSE